MIDHNKERAEASKASITEYGYVKSVYVEGWLARARVAAPEVAAGPYVPKVGDVVEAWGTEYVIYAFSPPAARHQWPILVYALHDGTTGAVSESQIRYLRPATAADRKAAGLPESPSGDTAGCSRADTPDLDARREEFLLAVARHWTNNANYVEMVDAARAYLDAAKGTK